MIKFVYFDIGGVLVDWSRAFMGAANKFGLHVEDIGEVFDANAEAVTKGIITPEDIWKECTQRFALKDAVGFDFLNSWVDDYRSIHNGHALVVQINKQFKVGLLSNIYAGMLPLMLAKKLIPNITYDQVVLSCEVGKMKPEVEIYDLAQERAGVSAREVLLIDDRQDYVDGAKHAGWSGVVFDGKDLIGTVGRIEECLKGRV
jgi:putative hydrolase of the HAD superfamily